MLSHPKEYKFALFLLAIFTLVTAVRYIWDFRKTAAVPPTTFFHVKTRSLTQDNNAYEKQEDLFSSKSPKLRSRMLALPNLVK